MDKLKQNKNIIALLLIALFFRIIVMFWSFNFRDNPDLLRYRDWATISYLYNFKDPYVGKHLTFGTSPINMPPGSLYTVSGMYRLELSVAKILLKITHTKPGELHWMNSQLINGFLRIPNILGDIVTGYLIYLLVKKYRDQKNALFAAGLFLFNPCVFYNSSFWGQMDAVNNALFFAALFLYYYGKKFLSVLFVFLSLYVKLTLVFLAAPFLLLMFLFEKYKKKFILSVSGVIALILAMTVPISSVPHIWFYNFLQKNSLGEMTNITSLAFNFWWVIFKPRIIIGSPINAFSFSENQFVGSPLSSTVYFGLPLFVWALIMMGIVLLPLVKIIFSLKAKILEPKRMFLLFSLLSLLSFLILPHMHERYLFPFFALMATAVGLTRKYLWIFISITLLNFINIYIIWHPMLYPSLPYALINSVNFQWIVSLLTVALGIILYASIYRYLKYNE